MDPFGSSRSRVRDDHALICADSFVAAPLPGWRGAKGIVLVSPRMGAGFAMYLAHLDAGAVSAPAVSNRVTPSAGPVSQASTTLISSAIAT